MMPTPTPEPKNSRVLSFWLGITSTLTIWLDGEMVGVVCHEHVGPVRQWALEEQNFAGSMGFSFPGNGSVRAQEAEEALRSRSRC